jgi:anti-sigma regulatory factor (Ser/Thr protein kinase)
MEINLPNVNDNKSNAEEASKPIKITIIFPTNVYFISGVRDFTLQIVKNLTGFSDQWAFRFQSVVDELCNNAIEHGSAPGKDINVSFVCVRNERLEVIVEDTGTGPQAITAERLQEIVKQKQMQDPTKIEGIRGRGMSHIVTPLSDEIHFTDRAGGGMIVRVVKYLKNAQEI